jgi:hypothetical protein
MWDSIAFVDGAIHASDVIILGYAGFFYRASHKDVKTAFILFLAPSDRLETLRGLIDDTRARYRAAMANAGAFEIPLGGAHNN